MFDKNVKIAVVGAGAIGGITAAIFVKEGYDVEVVSKYHGDEEKSKFRVFGECGEIESFVKTVCSIPEMTGVKDVVFLATKANDCFDAARGLLPYLHDNSAVVSLQNGLCEDELETILGINRTIGCVVEWSATRHDSDSFEMTADGEFIIGRLDGLDDSRLNLIQKMMDAIVPTRLSSNMRGELYSKLVINACINSLSVIAGQTTGEIVKSKKIRTVFIAIILEAMAVADKLNIKVAPRGGGKLNYYTFMAGKSFLSNLKRHIMVFGIGFKTRKIIPSSLQSLYRSQVTETEFFNGYISQNGKKLGIPTPANNMVVTVIKEIENGEREMGDYF